MRQETWPYPVDLNEKLGTDGVPSTDSRFPGENRTGRLSMALGTQKKKKFHFFPSKLSEKLQFSKCIFTSQKAKHHDHFNELITGC